MIPRARAVISDNSKLNRIALQYGWAEFWAIAASDQVSQDSPDIEGAYQRQGSSEQWRLAGSIHEPNDRGSRNPDCAGGDEFEARATL